MGSAALLRGNRALGDVSRPAPLAGGTAFLGILVLAAALTACSRHPQPDVVVLVKRCEAISGSQPFETELTAPRTGLLTFAVEQRGISSTVTFRDGDTTTSADSPVERYGLITLARHAGADGRIVARVESRDSPDIVGEVCLSAKLIDDHARSARAERAYAAAGVATRAREWDAAFSHYAAAARDFDEKAPRRAAFARHAMGELAYRVFNANREAQLLVGYAVRDFGTSEDAGLRSSLLSLEAKALLGMEGLDPKARRARVFALLDESERQARLTKFGAREVPRLDILRGFMEYVADKPDATTAHFERASQDCQAAKDWECYARARQNLGAMAEETRNYAFALHAFEDALERLDARVAPELAADIWGNLGRLQSTAGIIAPSAVSLGHAMRIYAQIGSCDGARRSLVLLGRLLAQVGSVEDALDYLRRGASLDCPNLLARIERDASAMGAESESPVQVARSPDRESPQAACAAPLDPATLSEDGKFAVFLALLSLNDLLLLEQENVAASLCLEEAQAYATSTRDRLRFATAQGVTELRRGETKLADASFGRALTIVENAGLSSTQNLASKAQLGKAEAALQAGAQDASIRFARRALETSAARGEVSQMVEALRLLAAAMRESKDTASATRTLEVAVRLIEQVPIDELDGERRATYLATQHAVFSELTELLIAGAQDEAATWNAFRASERGRARSLRFATSQAEHASVERAAVTTSERYAELVRKVAAPSISDVETIELSAYIERLGALVASDDEPGATPSAGSAQLLSQLERLDASLVEFTVGRDEMFAFVINNGHLRVVRLGKTREIAAAAGELYERIHDEESASADVQRSARALAARVIWPLREHITRSRLVIVPDDSLHTVPFAALPWSDAAQAELLVQRLEPVVVPSAAFLDRPPARAQQPARSLVLVGDPIFRERDWNRECGQGADEPGITAVASTRSMSGWAGSLPRLPATRDEVLNIAELARHVNPASTIRTELGCAATRTALRKAVSESPEILHVATHGFVDAHRPRLSALALSRESQHAGDQAIYTLMDILDSKLDSRLVVLSACETSRGRLLPGEGVLGPAQAFLQSGVASVLASHWRVADEETAAFMQSFYRNLLERHLPAAAALRRAQLERLAAGPAVHWAAFSLYGWPDISFK
jgi:CHAT domain-containing protein